MRELPPSSVWPGRRARARREMLARAGEKPGFAMKSCNQYEETAFILFIQVLHEHDLKNPKAFNENQCSLPTWSFYFSLSPQCPWRARGKEVYSVPSEAGHRAGSPHPCQPAADRDQVGFFLSGPGHPQPGEPCPPLSHCLVPNSSDQASPALGPSSALRLILFPLRLLVGFGLRAPALHLCMLLLPQGAFGPDWGNAHNANAS